MGFCFLGWAASVWGMGAVDVLGAGPPGSVVGWLELSRFVSGLVDEARVLGVEDVWVDGVEGRWDKDGRVGLDGLSAGVLSFRKHLPVYYEFGNSVTPGLLWEVLVADVVLLEECVRDGC